MITLCVVFGFLRQYKNKDELHAYRVRSRLEKKEKRKKNEKNRKKKKNVRREKCVLKRTNLENNGNLRYDSLIFSAFHASFHFSLFFSFFLRYLFPFFFLTKIDSLRYVTRKTRSF